MGDKKPFWHHKLIAFFCFLTFALSLPDSFPQDYPGKPSEDFSPAWQNYFEVTAALPNITFPLRRSFAGNLPVNRADHPNNTLFFYGFEKSNGSLTSPSITENRDPWGIWLSGGPGVSSMVALFFENGPIQIQGDYSAKPNQFSFDNLADYFWVDQPVGVGFSTADSSGYDEDQLGKDFMGFLTNLVKVFPSLAARPLHLTGESYAGYFIPYILKASFDMENPPVKFGKIAIGDGVYASDQISTLVPALSVLETYPQIIGYDQDVYNYFEQQTQLCGFDIKLTYPQNGVIPDPPLISPDQPNQTLTVLTRRSFSHELRHPQSRSSAISARKLAKRDWKTDALRANGTIDPWYGCELLDMFVDYAANYTFPWNLTGNITENILNPFGNPFNPYYIPDASNPKITLDGAVFMNDITVRTALHAPTSKDWQFAFDFPFGEAKRNDSSPPPSNFFTPLATNATTKGVGIVLFSGNADALVPHFGTEIAIQNTTFGGIQGFTRKPSTRWDSDSGRFAGVVHQERGWTYALFYGAGHMVPRDIPDVAHSFFRDFVFGDSQLGLVTSPEPGVTTVVGGENSSLEGVLRGQDEIFYGAAATPLTYTFPQATRDAWKTFHTAFQPTGS